MNYRMKIQYDGTRYRGWQRQSTKVESGAAAIRKNDLTIQGKIEAVLSVFAGKSVQIDGAGRTDAGVHALEQVANVRLPGTANVQPEEIRNYLNAYLPEDIRILSVDRAGERFHSRLNAIGKRYSYRLIKYDRDFVFGRKYAWKMTEKLDLQQMKQAAEELEGLHDFKSFCSKSSKKKSTVRRIDRIQIEETPEQVILIFEGNGFLYNMVRILTGTLVEVGTGKRKPEEMAGILQKGERRFAGETAPAQGLFLEKVYYD